MIARFRGAWLAATREAGLQREALRKESDWLFALK
jgi:hypothetical protein